MFFLLLAQGIVIGQDDQTPWPPDPETLFAEGVDVLEVELFETSPRSFADNEDRVVRIYNEESGEWQEYNYPDNQGGNYYLTKRSDGTFLLTSTSPPANWVINATENTITPLELVCGDEIPSLPGEGEWHYIAEGEAERAYLCFTETDDRISLPDEISNFDEEYVSEPAISPDENWLVAIVTVSEQVNDHEIYSYDVYGFEIATGRLNYLGRISHNMMASYPPGISHNWVSDTNGLISYGPPQESLSKSYYGFDASQPDSLEIVVQGWMYNFYSDPPRYDYVTTSGFLSWKTGSEIPPENTRCVFLRYDATGVQQHELGYDCIGADVVVGNDRLVTVRVDSDPSEFSTLVTYDLNNREFTEIVSGEIEWWFGGLSPYVLLLMDDSGQIDLMDFYPMYGLYDVTDYQWLGSDIEGAFISVWDTTTGEFVYDSRSVQRASSDGDVFAQWITNNRFIYSLDRGNPSLTLVELREDRADEYTIEGVSLNFISELRISPNGYRMLVYIQQENTIGVADFLSGEVFPLLNAGITTSYDLFFEWIDDNTLTIRVSQNEQTGIARVIYTVQVP
jgi:hypothetical protein